MTATRSNQNPEADVEIVSLDVASSGIPDVAVLHVKEVAQVLRTGTNVVYRTIASGALPAIRVGRSLRVTRTALVAFLEGERS